MATITALFDNNIDNINNQFQCLGQNTRSQYSLDGETWTSLTLTARAAITDQAFGNDVNVMTAVTANTADMIYTTTTPTAIPTVRTAAATGLANIGWQAIAFGNNTWVAVGGGLDTTIRSTSTKAITSTNSANWTLNSNLTAADWRCITYGESKFVTLSYGSNLVRYSSDGVTWSNGSGLPIGRWKSIVYDSTLSKFVAVSVMPIEYLCSSTSTLAFTSGTNTITRNSGNFTADLYIVGQTIEITGTSSNNGTYTVATVSTTTMTVNESLVTESASSTATLRAIKGTAYSDDGITWATGSPTSNLIPRSWIRIASNGSGRLMVSADTTSNDLTAYSDDGVNWTMVTLPLLATYGGLDYSPIKNRWLIPCQSVSNCLYSDDNGVSWIVGPSSGTYTWTSVKWVPYNCRANDVLIIDRGATITVNTDQPALFSSMTTSAQGGKLRIENTSTSVAKRFPMTRVSGTGVHSITPANGLGFIEVEGNWIEIGTGDNTSNQEMTIPYTDYVGALWVETGVGTNTYEIWLNVTGAYGGTLRQYQDNLLDVSTGQRGKFFKQIPSSIQDKYITKTATTTFGLFTITLDSTDGVYQGATITGQGIPANTIIEKVIDATTIRVSQISATLGASYTSTGYTNIPVRIINPSSSQLTNTVVFGDGVNGNKLTSGVKVRIPNIMLTSDASAALQTSSQQLGLSFVMSSGGNLSLDTCLLDEVYVNGNQAQSLNITNIGLHLPLAISETYALNINGMGQGMPCVRRYNTGNIWLSRELRDGVLLNGMLMTYVSNAVLNNIAMVLQSNNAVTSGSVTVPTGMINIGYSDNVTVSNVRLYFLNRTRQYQHGLAFPTPVTNSTFTNIEVYGLSPLSSQFSSGNTFTNIINSETMFSFSNNYTAGMRVTHDPNTELDMVDGTKYYFKSRTFYTRDRTEYTESRVYSATPFKGSTYFPDYVTAYVNAPQSVTFGWTHRVPFFTKDTNTVSNADAKNFLEIYRGTTPGFTPALSNKVAGFNSSPTVSIPTVTTWATNNRTLEFKNISITASGGRTLTFAATGKTITASSGNFTSDGFAIGDKLKITGTTSNNSTFTVTNVSTTALTVSETVVNEGPLSSTAVITVDKIIASSGNFITDGYSINDNLTVMGTESSANNLNFTITNVTALTINVLETVTSQDATNNAVQLVAKYKPTTKLFLTAAGGRTITTTGISTSRSLTFGGVTATPSAAPTMTASGGRTLTFVRSTGVITASSGSFVAENFIVGGKIYITGTTNNNTKPGIWFTISALTATTMTVTAASDLLVDEGPLSSSATIEQLSTTISSATGNFTSDGFLVGDKLFVSGTSRNNTTGDNYLTVTAVATSQLTCSGDLVFPEVAASAVLKTNRLVFSSGSVITDGYAPGDIIEINGSAQTSNNGKQFTILNIFSATVLNIKETLVSQAAESSGINLTTKSYPAKWSVYLDASPTTEISFQKSIAQSASTTRIFTFNQVAKTITASGTAPGNFITEGFVVGDKVVVTNSSLNNKITLTLTAVTATVLTASSTLERQYNEVSTTATLTAYRIKRSTGSFLTNRIWAASDKVTVSGTSSNDGSYYVANATALYLHLADSIIEESSSYKDTCVITCEKRIPRQNFYACALGASNASLATTSGARTLVAASTTFTANFVQNGFIVGDKVLINGHVYNKSVTLSGVSTTTLTWLDPAATATSTISANPITWVHTGQRPSFTTTASITLVWTAATKTLTIATSTWDTTYNFKVGDKILITGQKYNNGLFTIATMPTANTITVSENVIVDTTTYNATAGQTSTVYGYHTTQKVTLTSAAARVMTFNPVGNTITLSGASAGSFINDGYYVGDCIRVQNTTSGLNDGYYTIAVLTATVMTVNEQFSIVAGTVAYSTESVTISAPNIENDTDYYYVMRKYDDTGVYNDSEEIYVKSTFQEVQHNLALQGSSMTTSWTASGITVGAATRVSPLLNITSTQTAEAVILTSTAAGGTLTQSIPTAVGDTYTFSLWVCTQPTVLKLASLTATASRTLKFDQVSTTYTITAAGASPGSFITDGYQIGDRILVSGSGTPPAGSIYNIGWFTISNVTATVLTLTEPVITETAATSILTITNYFNDTLEIGGSISLGSASQAFTATSQWQKISTTFTAIATTTNAVITITDNRRAICAIGAMVNKGSSTMPYLLTTTNQTSNANKVRDINLVRAWCRGYAEPESHSGIELQLAAANTGELWTEVYCGTTNDFTPSFKNKIFDTWGAATSTTPVIIFNNESADNVIDGLTQVGIGSPTGQYFAYFAAASSRNKIKNVTYNVSGNYLLGIANFNTQSNDTYLYNWNIKNWRNYASTLLNVRLITSINDISGVRVENLIMNNSDIPIMNQGLNYIFKGVSGGNVTILNNEQLYSMPVRPNNAMQSLPSATVNFDSVTTAIATTNYVTEYDTIFNELYFTPTKGALNITFNASSKASKPYTLIGTANFSNTGRLYLPNPGDGIEYTWPHKILGVSGFRNVDFLFNGLDLGNTITLLEGLQIFYKIDTGSGYSVSWLEATPASLSALTVSATEGFYLKLKIIASAGMKYITCIKNFVPGETIRGLSSFATATVVKDVYFPTQGTIQVSNVVGTFVPGEIIVRDSDGEIRATNVATNTTFGLFPSYTSYIDGLYIYTNVDRTAIYPPEQTTLTLTGLQLDSEVRVFTHGTTTELSGIESSGTTFDFSYTYSPELYVDIVIMHSNYEYLRIDNLNLSPTSSSIPIQQRFDRVYSNP